MARPNQSSVRKLLTQNIVDLAKAFGQITSVGDVVTDDTSAAGVEVGFGNILRIQVGIADTYLAFGDSTIAAVTAATSPGLKLLANQIYFVVASDDFIRSSAAFARMELIHVRN